MALVAVAAVALLCGFFLGRVTADAKAATGRGDLQIDGAPAGGHEGARPGPPPADVGEDRGAKPEQTAAPRVVPLTREQEEAQVSNLAWLLLKCPARDRARAASAAVWLRDHGLPNARIRQVAVQADGSQLWYLVLCYTTQDTQAQDLERLRSLDLPTTFDSPTNEGTLSSLRESVRGLRVPYDTSNFKRR
ncbi:MAG: hypothetical protein HZB39_00500 [Planctomycetes bacterium]|nr:hypothetical protein [Planctomycetota bacterium]